MYIEPRLPQSIARYEDLFQVELPWSENILNVVHLQMDIIDNKLVSW